MSEQNAAPLLVVSPTQEPVEKINSILSRDGHEVRCTWVAGAREVADMIMQVDPHLLIHVGGARDQLQALSELRNRVAPTLALVVVNESALDEALIADLLSVGVHDAVSFAHPDRMRAVVLRELRSHVSRHPPAVREPTPGPAPNLAAPSLALPEVAPPPQPSSEAPAGAPRKLEGEICAHVQEGILVEASLRWLETLGLDESVVGEPVMDLFAVSSQGALRAALSGTHQGRWREEPLALEARGGHGIPVRLEVTMLPGEHDGEPCVRLLVSSHKAPAAHLNEDNYKAGTSSNAGVPAAAEAPEAVGPEPPAAAPVAPAAMPEEPATTPEMLPAAPESSAAVSADRAPARAEAAAEPEDTPQAATEPVPEPEELPQALADASPEPEEAPQADAEPAAEAEDYPQALAEPAPEPEQPPQAHAERAPETEDDPVAAADHASEPEDYLQAAAAQDPAAEDHPPAAAEPAVAEDVPAAHAPVTEVPSRDPDIQPPPTEPPPRPPGNITPMARDSSATAGMDDRAWLKLLRGALIENRFRLVQQPISSLHGEDPSMFEVLLRLLDPVGREILPEQFEGPAERHDMLKNIDRWVVGASLSFVAQRRPGCLFVRLSGDTARDDNFIGWIDNHLRTGQAQPERLCFQVPEAVAAENLDEVREMSEALRERGFRFALESFGTRPDSVELLEHVPVDFVKIDGTLMGSVAHSPQTLQQVRQLVEAAGQRFIMTIGENVQDSETMAVLWEVGMQYVQASFAEQPLERAGR